MNNCPNFEVSSVCFNYEIQDSNPSDGKTVYSFLRPLAFKKAGLTSKLVLGIQICWAAAAPPPNNYIQVEGFGNRYIPVHVDIFVWAEPLIAEIAGFKEAKVFWDGLVVCLNFLQYCRFHKDII